MDLGRAADEWRGYVYALLGLAYYEEPTRAFIQGLAAAGTFAASVLPPGDGALAGGFRSLGESLEPFRQGVAQEDLERFQWDYFRMFTGAGMPEAPPWESFYRTEERIIFSEYTLEVRAQYERFGLVSRHADKEPDDHIGLELEFMAHLSNRCEEGRHAGDEEAVARALGAQRDFLDDHLLQWAPRFCRDVCRSAETLFYAGIARLTERFLEWDRRFVADPDHSELLLAQ